MLKSKERIVWIFLLTLITSLSFFTLYNPKSAKAKADKDIYYYSALLQKVHNTLMENYVDDEKLTEKNLYYGAIKGMLESVEDPFTLFMDEELTETLNTDISGKFGGLGIYIGLNDDGWLSVISPIEDTPAEKIGMLPGDVIAEIEGESTEGMTTDQAVAILRGRPGSKVNITVYREGESEPIHFTITRAEIKIQSVKYKMLIDTYATSTNTNSEGEATDIQSDVGYIRVTTFGDDTPSDLKNAINELRHNGMKKLIIDLRNNPGGKLDKAIEIVDMFLDEGKIVYTRGRNPQMNQDYYASKRIEVSKDIPLAVLINGASASASEIFSGAIQDSRRGVLIGQTTFGKFSVQNVVPLDDKGSVSFKITTAHYYTPNGRSLHKKGIVPDVTVDSEKLSRSDFQAIRVLRDGEYIKEYIEKHPKGEEDARAFANLLSLLEAKNINVREELLRRLVYNERRKDNYKEIVDMKYDTQLKYAIDMLTAAEVFIAK